MAECKDCGISLTYSNSLATERCNKCHGAWLKNSVETNSAENTKSDLVADPMQYLKVKQIDFEEKVTIDGKRSPRPIDVFSLGRLTLFGMVRLCARQGVPGELISEGVATA